MITEQYGEGQIDTIDDIKYFTKKLEAAKRCGDQQLIDKLSKQIELLEDSVIVYKVGKNPERRVFYIDAENVSAEEASNMIDQLKQHIVNK